MHFPSRRLLCTVAAFSALFGSAALAQVTTDPVGFYKLTLLGTSDTLITIPFTRPPEFVGNITSVSQASGTSATISVSATTGWSVNQFVYTGTTQNKTYYALIGPNTSGTTINEGRTYTIVSSGTGSLVINPNGDTVSGITANTQVSMIPYWTLGSVFPDSDAGVSYAVTTVPALHQTEVQIPTYSGTGTNLASTTIYFYNAGAWRQQNHSLSENHDDDVLIPNGYLTVRNNGASSTTLTAMGGVSMKKLTIPLTTRTGSTKQDNFVSLVRPVDVQLGSLGLISGSNFVATTVPALHTDELLVYDNTAPGKNKSASAIYFYYNGDWRKQNDALANPHSTDVIKAGSGFVIRKAATAGGSTSFWTHDKTY